MSVLEIAGQDLSKFIATNREGTSLDGCVMREKSRIKKPLCKWLADEVCVNADCPYCADFCPSTAHPTCCVHFKKMEETENEDQA